jgi:hypothetical protein
VVIGSQHFTGLVWQINDFQEGSFEVAASTQAKHLASCRVLIQSVYGATCYCLVLVGGPSLVLQEWQLALFDAFLVPKGTLMVVIMMMMLRRSTIVAEQLTAASPTNDGDHDCCSFH